MPSHRETRISSDTQRWRGVDQRTQPTLVQEGFFTMSRGVYFGLGDNCERLPGKSLFTKLPQAVFQIFQLGDNYILQGLNNLYMTPREQPPTTDVDFTFSSFGDANGIFDYLGTVHGTTSWSNPSGAGLLTITSTAIFAGALAATVDRTTIQVIVDNIANSWIKWDFGAAQVTITDYLLRGRSDFSGDINPRNWKLQGSNDNSTWQDLDVRVNDASVGPGSATWARFTITPTSRWRYIRFLQNGLNAAGNNYLVLSEVEFYGTLRF